MSAHTKAILQALFVTLLWSTSWVLIKFGLTEMPPVLFAGLRYFLAFVILLPWLLRPAARQELGGLGRGDVVALTLLGLVYITINQGAQFLALAHLPAHTLSLMLSLSTLCIAFLGALFLKERLLALQWLGVAASLFGAFVYFGRLGPVPALGLAAGTLCVLATSVAAIQGRALNRQQQLSALTVTGVSIGIGSAVLLAAGLLTETMPAFTLREVFIIVWLAGANTAFAFILWNHTQRTLSAAQSGVINNTMLVQIAVLGWIFLGERITSPQAGGLALAAAGALLVQWRPVAAKSAASGKL